VLVLLLVNRRSGHIYVEAFWILKLRILQKFDELLLRRDRTMVPGWELRPKGWGKLAVVPNSNVVIWCGFSVDKALDGIS
jgi:hypothetical protein